MAVDLVYVSFFMLCVALGTLVNPNIIFPFVQPSCVTAAGLHVSGGWTGCLPGQICRPDGVCVSENGAAVFRLRIPRPSPTPTAFSYKPVTFVTSTSETFPRASTAKATHLQLLYNEKSLAKRLASSHSGEIFSNNGSCFLRADTLHCKPHTKQPDVPVDEKFLKKRQVDETSATLKKGSPEDGNQAPQYKVPVDTPQSKHPFPVDEKFLRRRLVPRHDGSTTGNKGPACKPPESQPHVPVDEKFLKKRETRCFDKTGHSQDVNKPSDYEPFEPQPNVPVDEKSLKKRDTTYFDKTDYSQDGNKPSAYEPFEPQPDVPVDEKFLKRREATYFDHTGYSQDGKCGPRNGGLRCNPHSKVYNGGCCSKHGWCGNTEAYCGAGCVSGCPRNMLSHSPEDSSKIPDLTHKSLAALGEPTLGQMMPSPTANSPEPTSTVTTDGTCGANYGETICGDWPKGSCCSMYGYCGNTTAHCGPGCQSGPCLNGTSTPAPGPTPAPMNPNPGSFNIVGLSGVPAMHAGLLENGRVVFLDKVEDYSPMNLTDGEWAYSSEYDPLSNTAVPLGYKTNAFCSGGSFLPDGRFMDVGGNAPLSFIDPTVGDGFTGIRYLERSATNTSYDGQSWSEPGNKLSSARWYPSAQTLADGSIFVASGSLNGLDPTVPANNNPTFEILDRNGISDGKSVPMTILEANQPYYMYPFIHLLKDGSLFVFVSKAAELFDVTSQTTSKTLPDLPGHYRTYPNTGGSVLLPLTSANNWEPEIVICGGGAYQDITSPTDPSCGSIKPLDQSPNWVMESMPEGRVMVESILLPDGTVVWLNGCNQGAQGFGLGQNPTLEALIYDPSRPIGQRFSKGASSTIARLYHSVALLLPDGTVMVAGSNPNQQPVLTASSANPFVTEYQVEIYTPPYLSTPGASAKRPSNLSLSTANLAADGSSFRVSFTTPANALNVTTVLYHGGFVTHSIHMGHRMLYLDNSGWVHGNTEQELTVTMPPNNNLAPPGPYMVFVVIDGIPSIGQQVLVA